MWLLMRLYLAFMCLTRVMGQSCPATFTTSECYFTGAATKQPAYSNHNQFFIVGGLFDVHNKGGGTQLCSDQISSTGILNVLAFFWAIDTYGAQIIDTSRVSVGAVAFDNCMRPEMTLKHILSYAQCDIHIQNLPANNLVAFVGPYTNEDVTRAGNIASDLKITLVSPTAIVLDQSLTKQNTLLWQSPSFVYDLKAVVEFLKQVKSGYVIIIYAGSDSFWKAAFDELKNQMDQSICIQYTADYNSILNDLLSALSLRKDARYIVPLMSKSDFGDLLEAMNTSNFTNLGSFIYIITSGIGKDNKFLRSFGILTNGSIVIDHEDKISSSDWTSFTSYLTSVQNNSMLVKYVPSSWLTSISSMLPSDWINATSYLKHSLINTLKSVQIIIQGIDTLMRSGCASGTNYQFCDSFRNQTNSRQDMIYTEIKSAIDKLGKEYSYSYSIFLLESFLDIGSAIVVSSSSSLSAKFYINVMDVNQFGYKFRVPVCPIPGECCEPPTTISTTTQQPVITSSGSQSDV